MVVLIAVFLVAVLVALATADDRAARIARYNAFASWAGDAGRILADRGTQIAERAIAGLAGDRRSAVGIDQLLQRPGRCRGAETEDVSEA